jgi:hypothetical protein
VKQQFDKREVKYDCMRTRPAILNKLLFFINHYILRIHGDTAVPALFTSLIFHPLSILPRSILGLQEQLPE